MCGYTILVDAGQTRSCGQAFWGALTDGYTVDKARRDVYDAYQAVKPADPRELMHVWGDFYTRLHGVYTGVGGRETRWFR